jgi:hypothetical protein
MNHKPWRSIFDAYNIHEHDFDKSPFYITAKAIKKATLGSGFTTTNETEARVLAKQDTRERRPDIFVEKGLFLLATKNGEYALIKGEGYVDIPDINELPKAYQSKLDFELETSIIGNSEMQHLDFAYASSLIRTFLEDDSLVLTIRGRKYTPKLDFYVGHHLLTTQSVQTEVDAGYEGRNQIVLIEAKNSTSKNTIIRQLYYPFRQWQQYTKKKVNILFFEKRRSEYLLWEFTFKDLMNYNSIELMRSAKFEIR